MNREKVKTHLPTVANYLEKRRKAKENRLPKHLRPPEIWPLWLQIVLNAALIVTLFNLMVDKDDYLTEAGPAIILIVCFLVLIYTLISAFRLRHRYEAGRARKLAQLNFVLMVAAFLSWAGSIVAYLP